MIDFESLVHSLLPEDSYMVMSEVDTDLADILPVVKFTVLAPQPLDNGPWQNGAEADILFTVYASTRAQSIALAGQLLADVEAMPLRPSPHGWVSSADVVALPWRPPGPPVEGVHQMQTTVRLVARRET